VISGCVDRPSITREDGIEVHRVKFQPKEGWKKRFWEKRVLPRLAKYPETQRRIEFALAARKRFRYLHDRTPIHLIESPEYFGSLYAIQWMRRRCPTMIKLHTPSEVNCWVNDVPVSKDIRLSNVLEKGSTKRADKITAPSRKIIDIVTKRWLPGVRGIDLLEYPIDTDIYSPGPGRVTPRKHFLFTGRLEHRKGVHLLVEAFAKVAAEIPDFDLHMAGHDTPTFARDGKQGMKFLEWIEGASIPPEVRKRIEFLGRVPLRDLIPLYRGAYACVIPSTSFENFPNSCLEAISCGKAVIVSDAGGMVEMVEHMQSGIHVKANDVASLAEAIRHLAQHPEDTARFGRRSREIVVERYATERIVARTMKTFDAVIAKGHYR
jgi:glycosyltransferase involved in cell wall biosynthesis